MGQMKARKKSINRWEVVLVSKCCLGVKCRYNGGGVLKGSIARLGLKFELFGACPETLGGLPVPREGCEVKKGVVVGRRSQKNYTADYRRGALRILVACRKLGIRKAYLLKNSPSCGPGYGITAKLLESKGIKVYCL